MVKNLPPQPLAGRIALVTGAQQGIGRAVVRKLAEAGADVVVNYLDDESAVREVIDEAQAMGARALGVRADISKVPAIEALMEQTLGAFGRLDILVNNAGIFPRSGVLELPEHEWDRVLEVNLKGTFFCAQAAARQMVRQGGPGAIVNMSSITIRGAPNGAHYVASKGGVASLTRALAIELAQHRIRVNALAPGLIDTAQPRLGLTEEQIEAAGRATPLGRIGDPLDVAEAALYLASDASSYITGQVLHVNGGSFMF